MHYIINKHGCYFHISPEVSMQSTPFKGCSHYNSEHELLSAAGSSIGLSVDDLTGSILEVFKNDNGILVCSDGRGIETPINTGIVEYVTNFEI